MHEISTRWLDAGSPGSDGHPPPARKSAGRPPCAAEPDTWDLDTGTPDSWRLAVEICQECPLLVECRELARTLTEQGNGPRGMIWAGVGYDSSGRVVESLERYRGVTTEPRRPLRIIRTGAEPVRTAAALTAPRRHIMLGHQLPRTGTDGC